MSTPIILPEVHGPTPNPPLNGLVAQTATSKKGFVMPPQDMPPKGGYHWPTFRMSTLQPKGLTTYQIVFTFFGLWGFGMIGMRDYQEWRNSRNLVNLAQMFAQKSLHNVLYGDYIDYADQQDADPISQMCGGQMGEVLPFGKKDKRVEAFIAITLTHEKKNKIDKWRQATRDSAVAPYQVCYGPDYYTTPHTCTKFCIHPDEVMAVRELDDIKRAKMNKNQGFQSPNPNIDPELLKLNPFINEVKNGV